MDIELRNELLRIYENGIKIDNELWVTRCPGNELYRIDLQNKSIKLIERFLEGQQGKLFSDVAYDGSHSLVLVPNVAEQLIIYNMKDGTYQGFVCKESTNICYAFGIVDAGYIYLFPHAMGGIAKVRMSDGKIDYLYNLVSYLEKHYTYKIQSFYAHYAYKGKLYLPLTENSVLIEYDYVNDEFNLYDLDKGDNIGIYNCMGVDEEIYLLDRYGSVYYFNISSKKTYKIFSLKDGSLLPYSYVVMYFNELWLIPYLKDKIVIFNMITGKVSFLNITPDESREKKYKKIFYENGKIWLYPNTTKSLIEIDMETRKMQGYRMPFSNTISEFISKLPKVKEQEKKKQYGDKIYKTLKMCDEI